MAWNTPSNKQINLTSGKSIPYGAPVTTNAALQPGRGYHDGWDIDRAYTDGLRKVTWLFRCIDALAGNQARLPVRLRKNNSPVGPLVETHSILKLFNSVSNPGENSFIFRYRLSAQLLMSTRGAFVEIVRGRDGGPIALHLLPPQHTSPIPDPKKFVAGFEIDIPGQPNKSILRPEDVLWFRHPHPLDPYLSMTPMEAAGVAIEIENLSKFYNRNFLINDGRPGGLIVVRGDMDEEDKEELRSRFRGNIGRAGAVSIIASEEGADYIDTGSNPRDAAYVEMRRLTKEEILAAFGVPESVIGNASGRTFSNAAEELRVFWMETMGPHLEMLARGFDPLDDKHWFEFDTTNVPILILAKQEREQYLLTEFGNGLITANEYRDGTGRSPVVSDLADSMLANPNLAPIGNTTRDMPYVDPAQQQPGMGGMPGAPGMPGAGAPLLGPDGMPMPGAPPAQAPPTEAAAPAAPEAPPITEPGLAENMQTLSESLSEILVKRWSDNDEWDTKAADSTTRWEAIMDRTLERFVERQQRVILEKARGSKARKALADGKLEAENLFDIDTWNKQISEDVRPVISGIVSDAAGMVGAKADIPVDPTEDEYKDIVNQQTQRIQQVNKTTMEEIAAAILAAKTLGNEDPEEGHKLLIAALAAIFVDLLSKRRRRIAEIESQAAFNGGMYLAGQQTGAPQKTWRTRRDDRVRPQHRMLEGKTIDIAKPFSIDGVTLRYPGDPLAPPHLALACRCRLKFVD
jgi:HK97 family phage portal protein